MVEPGPGWQGYQSFLSGTVGIEVRITGRFAFPDVPVGLCGGKHSFFVSLAPSGPPLGSMDCKRLHCLRIVD